MTAPSSLHVLRSLAWLRWRILINTLTRTGARDMLERLSRAAESVLPLAIAVMLIPFGIALAGVGGWAGWALARNPADATWPLQAVRWALLIMFALTVLSPMIISGGNQTASIVRLLLLPISTRLLYLAHAAAGIADPWVFLSIPVVAGVGVGLATNGQAWAGAIALLAGGAIVVALLGIAALASALLQLLVRNRRRAELVVLLGMLFVVAISILPSLLLTEPVSVANRPLRRSHRNVPVPVWVTRLVATLPSELYVATVKNGVAGRGSAAASSAAGLALWALALHGLTWPVYRRLLQTPATSGGRRSRIRSRRTVRTIPLVQARTSAVAVAFARLAFRTPRGRAVILMPIVMTAAFAAMSAIKGTSIPIGPVHVGGGYSLALFGIVMGLLSIGPLVFNQFAVDRAGLTLEFLAPISTRELLYGKALGGAAIAAVPCAVAAVAGAFTGARAPLLWLLVLLGACSSYAITAPVAAVLSLLFPRSVDLSSVGQGSNAHQVAGLLGFLAFALSCAPPVVLTIVSWRILESSLGAPILLAVWLAVALALSWIGFRIAERLLDERRENLAMVAQGR